MSEQTIFVCDGCLRPDTKRKPVTQYAVVDTGSDERIDIDAHDLECVRRYLTRYNKARREALKEARAATKSAKK